MQYIESAAATPALLEGGAMLVCHNRNVISQSITRRSYLILLTCYPCRCSLTPPLQHTLVLICHSGLKLIRISSEENLKEQMTHSQICPSFDIRRFVLTFALHTSLQRQTAWWRSCLYLTPTTSGPPHRRWHRNVFYCLNVLVSLEPFTPVALKTWYQMRFQPCTPTIQPIYTTL